VSPLSDPTRAVSSAAYLLFYRRRTARPIGGKKSLEAVESAIQSRQVSAQPSLQPSPFGSTDNLALHRDDDLTSSSIMPGSFDSTGEDHYRGGGGGGFSGIFAPRTLTSHNDDELDGDVASINSAEPGSPPSFRSSNDEPIAEWETSPPRSNRSRAVTPPQEPLEGQVRGLREGENLDDIE
jgi:ubiquitin carboxyl-terminal hydrolase 4/11/15